jgi:hypothetical protein
MMCPHMESTLNEYVDETLTAVEREAVEEHLAQCAGCRDAVAELRRLVAGARRLPPSLAPPRDFWAVIERRIGERPTWTVRRVWWRGAVAAAAVLVIALGLYRLLPSFTANYRPVGQGWGWAAVQADYEAATRELSGILAAERERLRPETVALVERNLAIIDAALAEARAALERDPANPELRRLFAAAYRQKVELLRWAARGAAS